MSDETQEEDGAAMAHAPRRVLVVDDSASQRRMMRYLLEGRGLAVEEAESGRAALDLVAQTPVDLVLSDWMMPDMDGLDFCRAYRRHPPEKQGYVILVTAREEKSDPAMGLDAGADDFLRKPVDPSEFHARVRAGLRILDARDALSAARLKAEKALHEVKALYRRIDRDLEDAARLQHSLVPERAIEVRGGRVELLLQPAHHIGGDLVGTFEITREQVVIYAIDVSGHGIPSALLTARLSNYFSPNNRRQNIAVEIRADGTPGLRRPDAIARSLSERMFQELDTDLYFTLAYADIDLDSGAARLVQAGHPHPLLLHPDGAITPIGDGGAPIGLVEHVPFEMFTARVPPGGGLLLVSDGMTECLDREGAELGEAGLIALLSGADFRAPGLLDRLHARLRDHCPAAEDSDDISAILFLRDP
ncbi:PP2C family protein-serine/threonine phosphatase [Oceanomicrobium pacificus]|uniref:SpoIIE family protein phosphatase n=1 Tax=Oceanomicrobium pacificus TaxID=2692916 RepID=A0A6B0TJM3_9RHOB|nr:SpoIIE family protein phosphatase [Oceanomicrobium pacificus]MXU64637.1 SpoIIE family protein phosphatase [Oceanomicrobium pacificus]